MTNLWNVFLSLRQGSVGSFGSDSTFAGGEGEAGPPGVKITEIQAAWNVTNAIQGMFIVSLPFAVLRGGYWAIVAMVGIAYICCYTGKVRRATANRRKAQRLKSCFRFSSNVFTSRTRRQVNPSVSATATSPLPKPVSERKSERASSASLRSSNWSWLASCTLWFAVTWWPVFSLKAQ